MIHMNILVLGNGFDLAHKLPTAYEDFLNFTDAFIEYKNKGNFFVAEASPKTKSYLKDLFNRESTDAEAQSIIREMEKSITDNVWITHFKNIKIGQGWVDFENEISSIVQEFESVRSEIIDNIKNDQSTSLKIYQIEKLERFFSYSEAPDTLKEIARIKKHMLEDLKKLTRALEIYLSDYVNNLPVSIKLPDIDKLEIDKVLSFNYTNTYERIYGKRKPSIEYDYIHGKAEITHDVNSCNLVLGIDEYLTGDEKNRNTEFIQFKKFFQRIYKKTGCKYMDWINTYLTELDNYENCITDNFKSDMKSLNIYIFGHSLDITDKDILAALIQTKYAKTKIFHFNQDALGTQIANLVKIIGQDTFISMVHGKHPDIILQQQLLQIKIS